MTRRGSPSKSPPTIGLHSRKPTSVTSRRRALGCLAHGQTRCLELCLIGRQATSSWQHLDKLEIRGIGSKKIRGDLITSGGTWEQSRGHRRRAAGLPSPILAAPVAIALANLPSSTYRRRAVLRAGRAFTTAIAAKPPTQRLAAHDSHPNLIHDRRPPCGWAKYFCVLPAQQGARNSVGSNSDGNLVSPKSANRCSTSSVARPSSSVWILDVERRSCMGKPLRDPPARCVKVAVANISTARHTKLSWSSPVATSRSIQHGDIDRAAGLEPRNRHCPLQQQPHRPARRPRRLAWRTSMRRNIKAVSPLLNTRPRSSRELARATNCSYTASLTRLCVK